MEKLFYLTLLAFLPLITSAHGYTYFPLQKYPEASRATNYCGILSIQVEKKRRYYRSHLKISPHESSIIHFSLVQFISDTIAAQPVSACGIAPDPAAIQWMTLLCPLASRESRAALKNIAVKTLNF